MENEKFEYAKNRFCNPKKIIEVSVYSKQSQSPDSEGQYPAAWRVALTIDVQNKDKGTLYSDAFETERQAVDFAKSVPIS